MNMVVLQILLFAFTLLLILAALNKKRIRAALCSRDKHFFEKKKYRCIECGKGQTHLTLIDGYKQDIRKVKF